MMKLLLNVGNTNVTLGFGDTEVLGWEKFRKTDSEGIVDYICSLRCVYSIQVVYIASVVPSFHQTLLTLLAQQNLDTVLIEHTHVDFDYTPYGKELGLDRLLTAYAAWRIYQRPLIVFDLGTATSVQIVNHNQVIGGLILAGLRMGLEALNVKTDLLPSIASLEVNGVIAQGTKENLAAGAVFGMVGAVEGITCRVQEALKQDMVIIITGGNARYLRGWYKQEVIEEEALLLKGILWVGNEITKRKHD